MRNGTFKDFSRTMAAKSFRQLIKVCFLRGRGQCGMYNIKREKKRRGTFEKTGLFFKCSWSLSNLKIVLNYSEVKYIFYTDTLYFYTEKRMYSLLGAISPIIVTRCRVTPRIGFRRGKFICNFINTLVIIAITVSLPFILASNRTLFLA